MDWDGVDERGSWARQPDHVHDGGWRFLQQLIDPDDRERVQAACRSHLSGDSPNFSVDFRASHGTGRLVWVNWRGVAEFEDGAAVRMAGSLSDLAERGSSYDALTNLPGRPLFRDRLAHAIALHRNEADLATNRESGWQQGTEIALDQFVARIASIR